MSPYWGDAQAAPASSIKPQTNAPLYSLFILSSSIVIRKLSSRLSTLASERLAASPSLGILAPSLSTVRACQRLAWTRAKSRKYHRTQPRPHHVASIAALRRARPLLRTFKGLHHLAWTCCCGPLTERLKLSEHISFPSARLSLGCRCADFHSLSLAAESLAYRL